MAHRGIGSASAILPSMVTTGGILLSLELILIVGIGKLVCSRASDTTGSACPRETVYGCFRFGDRRQAATEKGRRFEILAQRSPRNRHPDVSPSL
jgi:hypothetical protein